MKTAILQPTYLPWLGYFEMIDACEQYVIFDHVQFEPKSWQQRNRIKGPNGEIKLTVPVRSDRTQQVRICDKRINYDQPWIKKHLRSIEMAYGKAPFFSTYYGDIRPIIEARHERLSGMTSGLIRHFIEILGIETRVVHSSHLVTEDDRCFDKTGRVVNVCRLSGATALYDGAAAKDFLELGALERHGIDVSFQEYAHPVYPQQGSGFNPYMSVIDLIFNCGEESLSIIRSGAGR